MKFIYSRPLLGETCIILHRDRIDLELLPATMLFAGIAPRPQQWRHREGHLMKWNLILEGGREAMCHDFTEWKRVDTGPDVP